MSLIVKTKTKKQERDIKAMLADMDVEFITIAEEDEATYKTTSKKTRSLKEKKILENLEQSVDFVNKYKKGKTKVKSLKQMLDEL